LLYIPNSKPEKKYFKKEDIKLKQKPITLVKKQIIKTNQTAYKKSLSKVDSKIKDLVDMDKIRSKINLDD